MTLFLASLVALSLVSLVITNVLWLRHFRYLTNLAISKNPVEFATLQAASKQVVKHKDPVKHIRPEGI